MIDQRIEKYAELLVNYCVAVKPHDKVIIHGNILAEPLLSALYKYVLKVGAYPLLDVSLPNKDELLFKNASEKQISYIHETEKHIVENYDVDIFIESSQNTKNLTNINPSKIALHAKARKSIRKTFMHRVAKEEMRWVYAIFPTNALAQDAAMSLSDYEDFVYNACLPDLNNPIAYWQELQVRQQKIVDWFVGKKKIHVIAEDTDLKMSIDGRTFSNCDGRENMPDGEVFTGPIENSVEGHIKFSFPGIYKGNEVEGVQLWFEQGKVVKATADKNETFLNEMINSDEGAQYVGEFAIATNENITKFTKSILFDEKIGGTIHIALGAGYPETGSKNESGIHWDMICDTRNQSEIWVDDELIFKNGEFVIGF